MRLVPRDTPVIMPVEDPIAATPGVALVHVPPAMSAVSVEVLVLHTFRLPEILANGLTVYTVDAWHPVAVTV